jgi:hypothetical protein
MNLSKNKSQKEKEINTLKNYITSTFIKEYIKNLYLNFIL